MPRKNDYIKGINIVIGGETSELTESLKKVDKQIKSTEDELKTVERLLKFDPKNTDLLAKKQQLLSSEIDTTKQKLESLKKAKTEADKVIKNGTADQLKAYAQLQDEIKKTEDKLKSLKTSASKFTEAGEKLTSVGNKMTEVGQKGMVLTGAISALGAGVAATAETTREYREDMSRLESAFVTAGKTTESAKKAYNDFYVILGESDRSVEAVNHLAKLCNSEQELADWSTICAGVSATFGDSLPIEGLTEAANETAKVGKVTGPLADALNWAGVSEDAFNEKLEKCNSEQERSQLITGTLTTLYQEAAIKFKSMNADVIASREATQKWNDAIAQLGATVEPILTAIREKMAQLLTWFNQLNDGQKKLLAGVLAITAAGPPLLVFMGNTITSIGTLSKALGSCNGKVTALFSMLKSPPAGLVIGSLAAIGVATYAYAAATDEAAQKTRELTKESRQLATETEDMQKSLDKTENSIAAESNTVNDLIDRLYSLEGQDNKTTKTKEEMHSIINQLNNLIPDLNLSLDDETGRLNIQRGVVQSLANDYINLAYAKAYSQQITELTNQRIKIEANNQDIEEQISKMESEKTRPSFSLAGSRSGGAIRNNDKVVKAAQINALNKAVTANNESISKINDRIGEYTNKIAEYTANIGDGANKTKDYLGDLGFTAGNTANKASKAAKSASKSTKKEVDKMKEAFDDELKTLKEDLSYGFITQKDYYNKLAEMRDYYLKKGSSDWWTYTKEIIKYERDKADELKKVMSDVSKDIESTTENYLNQRKQLTESFENALKPDSLYDTTVLIYGDKKIEMNSLKNFKAENENTEKFFKRLEAQSARLKEAFGEDEDGLNDFLNTIRSSPYGEGGKLIDVIENADDEELKEAIKGYQALSAKVQSGAERSYSKELSQMSEDFNTEIKNILSGIPDEFKDVGKSAAEYFGKGFSEQMASVLESIKKIMSIDFGGFSPSMAGTTNNSVNNSRTNNFNVNVSNVGPQQDMTSLGRKIANAIWLGGEL